jgi:hypothetical protein
MLAGLLIVLAGVGLVRREEPRSRMTVGFRSMDEKTRTAIFVLTNATTSPASIIVKGVEVRSNGVWVARAGYKHDGGTMILYAGLTLAVTVEAQPEVPWRVRFTSIEKAEFAGLGYRFRLFFEQARTGIGKGWDAVFGEVYHDVELVSEEMGAGTDAPGEGERR